MLDYWLRFTHCAISSLEHIEALCHGLDNLLTCLLKHGHGKANNDIPELFVLVTKEDGNAASLVVVRAWSDLEDFLDDLDNSVVGDRDVGVTKRVHSAAMTNSLDELGRWDLARAGSSRWCGLVRGLDGGRGHCRRSCWLLLGGGGGSWCGG